jgi:formate dehydrogenase subunit beta
MERYAHIPVANEDLNGALRGFVSGLLESGIVEAVLVPARQPFGSSVMQTLIAAPAEAEMVDPLAPVVPASSATLLARITRREKSQRIAAFLRPCEVRAFIELVKLRQASREGVLLVGMDCHGRYDNRDFLNCVGATPNSTMEFLKAIGNGRGTALSEGLDIVDPCKACVTPEAANVDLRLLVIGFDPREGVGLETLTPAGAAALESLGLPEVPAPAGRPAAMGKLLGKRSAFKTELRQTYREKVKEVDGLLEVISNCINCYNCRVACPVCYCRECVFLTDTFDHEGRQYLHWARKRGRLRMPSDTLFYHLTRMAHMSTLCVACGQCTSACPNGVPVSELFSMVGEEAQAVFGYVPGRDPEEKQPMAHFLAEELEAVTGQVK